MRRPTSPAPLGCLVLRIAMSAAPAGKVARLIRRVEMDMDAGMRGAKVAEDRRQHGHSEDFHRR